MGQGDQVRGHQGAVRLSNTIVYLDRQCMRKLSIPACTFARTLLCERARIGDKGMSAKAPRTASSGVDGSATGFISTRYANAPSEFALKVGHPE